MVRVKCLAILYVLITLPTRSAILSLPRSGCAARRVAAAMVVEFFFGGGQQLAAFAGALVGQGGVAAARPAARRDSPGR